MGCRRIDLYARIDGQPTDAQRAAFRDMVRAAAEHRPIAYIVGRREFYSLDFLVTPDVLIPRPETELIVERICAWCREHPADRHDLLDIGTGSGCIAIAAAVRTNSIRAVATDISEPALSIARQNAEKHRVAERIRFAAADGPDLADDLIPAGSFDLVVSNPPYVAERDRASLPANVRDYEPAAALFAGDDGLAFFRRIAAGVDRLLRTGGTLVLEVGAGQADRVEEIFTQKSTWASRRRFCDLAGMERTLQFVLPADDPRGAVPR
jgi:release factor glutamine methyltransferase